MIIQLRLIPSSSISDFADRHGLTMTVRECATPAVCGRYVAQFDDVEIAKGNMVESARGFGNTPVQAIARCVERISGKTIVINAFRPTRREIQVPRLFM